MFESAQYNIDYVDDEDYEVNLDFLKEGKDKNFEKVLKDMNQFSDDLILNRNPQQQEYKEDYNDGLLNDPQSLTQQIKQNDHFLPSWQSERQYEKAMDKIDKLYGKIMEPRFVDKKEQPKQVIDYNKEFNYLPQQQVYAQQGFNYPNYQDIQHNQNCQMNAPISIPMQPQIYQPVSYQNYSPMMVPMIPQYQQGNVQQYPMEQYPIGMPINYYQNMNGQQQVVYGQPI